MDEKDRKQKPIEIEEVPGKYVNVRRRITYIKQSLDEGTQAGGGLLREVRPVDHDAERSASVRSTVRGQG